MSFHCAISNEIPEEPVVSPHSGAIFERRLIVKYIEETGKDPVSGQDLRVDELITLKTDPLIKPKPPSATSIPALLRALQDEWDAVMLYSHNLRQQLQTTRQELSYSMYQHDAACRVIARLSKDLNAAREALATMKPRASVANIDNQEDVQPDAQVEGITEEQLANIDETAAALSAERKKRSKNPPSGVKKASDIQEYKAVASHTSLHSVSKPGIISLDLCETNPNRIVTGGIDHNVVVFDKKNEEIVTALKGHTKKVNCVTFVDENVVISGSVDNSIRVWNIEESATRKVIQPHEGGITSISLHPTKNYLLSTSNDEKFALSDIHTGRVMLTMGKEDASHSLNVGRFHPDGLLFATGTSDSIIQIWDLKSSKNVVDFPGHTGAITALAFCENGFYMASAGEDSCVKLWDLRKGKNIKTIEFDEGTPIKDIAFDYAAQYVAVASNDIRVFVCKQWDEVKTFGDHTANVTGVRFGPNAEFIVSTSMDRSLKIFA